MIKKAVLIFVASITLLLFLGATYIFTAPDLPENADELIETAMALPLPEFYTGEAAIAKNGDIKLWYEINRAEGEPKGTIMLIMGYGSSSLQWPPYFIEPLQSAGFDVIRFDHRDIGLSTWVKDWDPSSPYTLEDIAGDVVAILDHAGKDKAHMIGVSMGGMIAQAVAINHPNRTQTLTSMSSTGYFADENLAGIYPETVKSIARYTIKYAMNESPETNMRFNLTASNLFKGNYELDNTYTILKTRYELEKRKGFNPDAGTHHEAAIKASGSRYEQLQQLDVPTLIIHGRADPLVNFEHGAKTAELIPNAKTLYIDDLGHDIPRHFAPQMVDAILKLIR